MVLVGVGGWVELRERDRAGSGGLVLAERDGWWALLWAWTRLLYSMHSPRPPTQKANRVEAIASSLALKGRW